MGKSIYHNRPLTKPMLAQWRRERAADLYSKGVHVKFIAERLGIAYKTARKLLSDHVLEYRKYDKYDDIG